MGKRGKYYLFLCVFDLKIFNLNEKNSIRGTHFYSVGTKTAIVSRRNSVKLLLKML